MRVKWLCSSHTEAGPVELGLFGSAMLRMMSMLWKMNRSRAVAFQPATMLCGLEGISGPSFFCPKPWAPAVLPCALQPCIQERQWLALPDLSAATKHELQLKGENTVSAVGTNCSWHLGKDTSHSSCQRPHRPCPLSDLNDSVQLQESKWEAKHGSCTA